MRGNTVQPGPQSLLISSFCSRTEKPSHERMELPFKTPPVTSELHWRHVYRFSSSYLGDESRGIITFLGLLKLLDDPPLSALCRIYLFNLSAINQVECLRVHLKYNVDYLQAISGWKWKWIWKTWSRADLIPYAFFSEFQQRRLWLDVTPNVMQDNSAKLSYINTVSTWAVCANKFLEADIKRPTTCLPALVEEVGMEIPLLLSSFLNTFVVSIFFLLILIRGKRRRWKRSNVANVCDSHSHINPPQ